MIWLLLIPAAIAWLGCSVLVYQYTRAFYRWEYHVLYDANPVGRRVGGQTLHQRAFISALFGPTALPGMWAAGYFKHGRNWTVRTP